MKKAAVAFLALFLTVSVGLINAFALPLETVVTAENGAVCELENGEKITIPKGETVIITDHSDQVKIRYKNYTGTVDPKDIEAGNNLYGEILKLNSPVKYLITDNEGVPVYSFPNIESTRLGKIPCGETVTATHYVPNEFWEYAFVKYGDISGWIYVKSGYETAEYPDPSATREIITVKDGLRLTEKTDSGKIKECSEPIPYGTKLKYDYCRNEYYEGGVTSYYTEYKGAKGWLTGASFTTENFPYYETTLDRGGYFMISDDSDFTLGKAPFEEDPKVSAEIPKNIPVKFESQVAKVVDLKTGKELPKDDEYDNYKYDFNYYDHEEYADVITSLKLELDGAEIWLTYHENSDVFLSTEEPSVYYSFEDSDVYGDMDLSGKKLFTLPSSEFGNCCFYFYDDEAQQEYRFIEYNGKYGWVKGGKTADEKYIYTAFEDIPVYKSAENDEVIKTVAAGRDFNIIESFFNESDKNNGRALIKYDGAVGWIDSESDYLLCGFFDVSKQIDIPQAKEIADENDPGENLSETAEISKPETDKNEKSLKFLPVIIACAAVLSAAAIIILVKRRNKKSV